MSKKKKKDREYYDISMGRNRYINDATSLIPVPIPCSTEESLERMRKLRPLCETAYGKPLPLVLKGQVPYVMKAIRTIYNNEMRRRARSKI